ncbi:hypothetical protein QYE76_010930 [Lolium multiflorum]|uniref:Chromo domain-containing protein n=1 Tax=Lolium multiflorum TaxID=4521 RepID=A0AAD8X2C5_LOLMU|nr:hypothetical protein QYE76_010930 [Lolium multiflorum]
MARGKKDSPAAGGSGDLMEEDEAAEVVEEEEEPKGVEEEEDWKGEEDEDEDEDEEEEWEQEDEQDEEEEEDEAAPAEEPVQGVGSPAKLADGYYEIETIRRRRLRKGQKQYLVKWRGWPESANTWEPAENLTACSDFVDAFEKRQQPRYHGKRKRKITTIPVRSPNTSHGKRGRPRRSDPRFLSHLPAPERKTLPLRTSSRRATNNTSKNSIAGFDASVNVVAQPILAQSVTREGSSSVPPDGFPCQGAPISVVVQQQDELQPGNGLSTVENPVHAPPSQGVQVTGAKKRKLGSVRRFKQDEVQQDQGELQTGRSGKPGAEDVDSTEGETGDRTKGQGCGNQLHIIKIIKPVRYFATMTDDVQQVSITFKALRSDGEEIFVDDKELKNNNPLVLINYYEQHLRYNPTS